VQAGADVIVEVGGEAVSDAGGFASAEMSTDQESGGDQEEESNGEALEKEEGGLLFLVARFQVGAEQSKLGFEVVSSGQLVHPGADGENVTVEIVAVGELGPAGVFLSGEVDVPFLRCRMTPKARRGSESSRWNSPRIQIRLRVGSVPPTIGPTVGV